MIEFSILTLPEHTRYVQKISLLNTMVFEELYQYYYGIGRGVPYDYYHADNVISPMDTANHNDYFRKVKPQAIKLWELWQPELLKILNGDSAKIKSLSRIGDNIVHAKDMVDLVWYSMQLLDGVRKHRKVTRESI